MHSDLGKERNSIQFQTFQVMNGVTGVPMRKEIVGRTVNLIDNNRKEGWREGGGDFIRVPML